MNDTIDCLIIGSGPAGYTAAIYAARAGLNPVIIMGLEPGGQLTTTTEVENFPGYPQGVDGSKMMEELKQQAERFGTDIRYGYVNKVEFGVGESPLHKVSIDEKSTVTAKTVIIATGASAKYLGLESEEKLKGGGVSACAVCDGFFYKGQEVAVVGAGDTAAEEATYLSKICNTVHMLVRKGEMRASKLMQERVKKTKNIQIHFNTEVDEVLGDNVVESVRVFNNLSEEKKEIAITGLFIAIGHKPNTNIFEGALSMDSNGYILTEGKSTKTNVLGVFACGDVQDNQYRQAVTAAGTGCMAALDAERYLATIKTT